MNNVTDLDKIDNLFNEKRIAKNTIYNLFGYGLPLIVALFFIPSLIKGLGEERFGILSLSWMIIGYFSFFDLGIGRGLTKITSEKIGLNQTEQIPVLFWSSIFLMLIVSFFAAIGLILLIPSLINIFSISKEMQHETLITFYALAISIPIVSTTAGLRGVLEAYQKWGIINIMRIILGIFTFLGPLLVLFITNSLFWIVVFLIVIRVTVWLLYFFQCFKANENIRKKIYFDFPSLKPILKFSFWIAIANIVGPIILYSDRFFIGAIESAKAVTYYSSPYEVVTKLFIIPGSIAGVLFPLFSASFFSNPEVAKKIFIKGAKFIFLILYPVILLIVTFSYEGMELWLGEKFAVNSSLVLQLLSIGVLMNGIGIISDNFFQGVGKPKIPSLIYIIELPFFILAMWFFIGNFGIKGAALVWMSAASLSAIALFLIINKKYNIKFQSKTTLITFLILMMWLIVPFFLISLEVKIIFLLVSLLIFIILTWNHFLTKEEKYFISSKLKLR